MPLIDHIQTRRDVLAAQMTEAQQQYDQLEATLKQLDRSICAMHGGLQELDALLTSAQWRVQDDQEQKPAEADQQGHGDQ